MTRDDVIGTVRDVLLFEYRIDNNTNIREDLDIDSLDYVELIMGLEKEFDIDINDEDTEKLVTVGDVVDYVCDKVGATN